MDTLKAHISKSLDVRPNDVVVIGSARTGFSLAPDNFPRRFSKYSDIDVLIVNQNMFDIIWHTLLAWHYPRRFTLPEPDWNWLRGRRDEVYWGRMEPGQVQYTGISFPETLVPMRDLSAKWFNTFQSLSRFPELMSRRITGRLYRTWDHAMAYHVFSLNLIKKLIEEQNKG